MRRFFSLSLVVGLLVVLLAGCGWPGFGRTAHAAKFINAGGLKSFHYMYFDDAWNEHQFAVYFSNSSTDEALLSYYGHPNLSDPTYEMYVADGTVLQTLADIIEEHDIYQWDGETNIPFFSASRTEFLIQAEFENASLEASSNMRIPEEYQQGHAAISSYLMQLRTQLPRKEIGEDDVFTSLAFSLPVSGSFRIDFQRNTADYNRETNSFQVDISDANRAGFMSFANALAACYNNYRGELSTTPGTAWATVYIGAHNETSANTDSGWFSDEDGYSISLPLEQYEDIYITFVRQIFALMGLPEDYDQTPEYDQEADAA